MFDWFSGSILQWVIVGLLSGLGTLIALCLTSANHRTKADDDEQAEAMSRPASLATKRQLHEGNTL